jgi:DNA-binding NarL/FixJ family response regulator
MRGTTGVGGVGEGLEPGRAAFHRGAWAEAYGRLSELDGQEPLPAEDLERLAVAAYLVGRDDDSAASWERAYNAWVGRDEPVRAARCAGWLAFGLLIRGRVALGQGWLARTSRLLDEAGDECAERAYPLIPAALQHIEAGDHARGYELAAAAVETAERFGDRDLAALGRHIQGRALIRLGRTAEGTAIFDELMIVVSAQELSPVAAGLVYCSAIEGCQETADVRRAQEWTAALTRWCAAQPDLVPYRGECLVHRAEILLLHGAWVEAEEEISRCLAVVADHPAAAAAWYVRAELHRLTGRFGPAEEAYRQTSRLGRDPQPGLARLRLAQRQVDAAAAAIRRALGEATDWPRRGALLGAYVDIMLAAGDVAAARAGADELVALAGNLDTPLSRAVAARALGAVRLAEGDAREALAALRRAWAEWRELDAAYEAGRVRVVIAEACRALDDEDGAQLELDAASWIFQQLGAGSDQQHVHALLRPAGSPDSVLTAREQQVLRLVASGRTNRAIAAELFLSEKTVARHVGNILAKLRVRSRSAATAYAYEHGLAG